MKSVKVITALLLTLVFAGFLAASPVIEAGLSNYVYRVGDIVTVKINISNNPGFNGCYFDLHYNGNVLSFDRFLAGEMAEREAEGHDLVYAAADPVTAAAQGDHLLASFVLNNPDSQTVLNGTLAVIQFRVIDAGAAGERYQFSFTANEVRGRDENLLTAVEWRDSLEFVIRTDSADAFIHISSPYENQSMYDSFVAVKTISTINDQYKVILANPAADHTSDPIATVNGVMSGANVPLVFGFNPVKAILVDQNLNRIAEDDVRVYRSQNNAVIRIAAPENHTLLNTDFAPVLVYSTLAKNRIYINDSQENIRQLNEKQGNYFQYAKNIWLKRGFNKITARAVDENLAVYTDTIYVYYTKDDRIFRFLKPDDSSVIKVSTGSELSVIGEISSRYQTTDILNTVTLKVNYLPNNPDLKAYTLVDNRTAVIEENNLNNPESQAPYIFRNDFKIPLTGLESGRLEIIAYKNKSGVNWEDMITRYVYLDKNQLSIELLQPKIYGSEELDTLSQITGFNHGRLPYISGETGNDIILTDSGSFTLNRTVNILRKGYQQNEFKNFIIQDLVQENDGTLYALVNYNSILQIYKKSLSITGWTLVVSQANLHGYDLCITDAGLLVGAYNGLSSNLSGLYLLKNNRLYNIAIGEPLTQVQFVENHDGMIWLYGNNYSHLYGFNIFSLEYNPDSGIYESGAVRKIAFDNSLFIDQFVLSGDGKLAVIRTRENQVFFYRNQDNYSFARIQLKKETLDPDARFSRVIMGEYSQGNYNAILLIGADGVSHKVVMDVKAGHSLMIEDVRGLISAGETLIAADYRDEDFYFLFYTGSHQYRLASGQILFDRIYWNSPPATYTEELGTGCIPAPGYRMFVDYYARTYYGIGTAAGSTAGGFYELLSRYITSGDIGFDYLNPDVEGIKGFQFAVSQIWQETNAIQIGFTLKKTLDDSSYYRVEKMGLKDLLAFNAENETVPFSVYSTYDDQIGKNMISIVFKELVKNLYPSFDIRIEKVGDAAPEFSHLTVDKKIKVKLPRSGKGILYLPIHGRVADKTAERVQISGFPDLILERDGAFGFNYPLYSSETEKRLEISCRNPAGETASVDFMVEIFDSTNDLIDLKFRNSHTELPLTGNRLTTEEETLLVSGYYYGLKGARVGYSLYKSLSGNYLRDTTGDVILVAEGVFGNFNQNFTTASVKPPELDLTGDTAALGANYEYGKFWDQVIPLYPGDQQLCIFVENPGGFRTEYRVNGDYPLADYQLQPQDQMIRLANLEVKPAEDPTTDTLSGILIDKEITLYAKENSNQVYTLSYGITGSVKSLKSFKKVRLESLDPCCRFGNGQTVMETELDWLKNFSAGLTVTLPEDCEEKRIILLLKPDRSDLSWLSTGLYLRVIKDYRDAGIAPDFSLMKSWSPAEINNLSKPVRLKFDRFIPESAYIELLLNYEKTISGTLVRINPEENIYKLVSNNREVELNGVKSGTNRVQWWLYYSRQALISASSSGVDNMKDFIFTISSLDVLAATVIQFPIKLQTYYNDTDSPIPHLSITKDPYTDMAVFFNQNLIWQDNTADQANSTGFAVTDWSRYSPKQGMNYLKVQYQERSGKTDTAEYQFYYDTIDPLVKIGSYNYDAEHHYLKEFSAVITEANLDSVQLLSVDISAVGQSRIDAPLDVQYLGKDFYRATWSNLESFQLRPTPGYPVRVRAVDYAGRSSESADFTGITTTEFPQDPTADLVYRSPDFTDYVFNRTPYFMRDDANDPFGGHLKYYSDSIVLNEKEMTGTVKIQRPDQITLGSTFSLGAGAVNDFALGGAMRFKEGFRVKNSATVKVAINPQMTTLFPAPVYSFIHKAASDAVSIVFWFRDEHEDYYDTSASAGLFRKIITLYEKIDPQDENKNEYLYLGYQEGSQHLYFVLAYYDTYQSMPKAKVYNWNSGLALSAFNTDYTWNKINVGLQKLEHQLILSVNDQESIAVSLEEDQWNKLNSALNDGSIYYFGDKNTHNNGHFSVAQPFYINALVDTETALQIAGKAGMTQTDATEPACYYFFNNNQDDVGTEYYKLRVSGSHFSAYENVNYTESAEHGSLKVSSRHQNVLKITSQGVIFDDATNPVTINLNVQFNPADPYLKLTPVDPAGGGRYFFGNRFGNHGLYSNQYYSVAGYIKPALENGVEIPVKARLVVRINGKEQGMDLIKGNFHFVYEHTTGEVLDDVVMYIEAKSAFYLDKNLFFNEGNYTLPPEGLNDLDESYASTRYHFYPKGTVDFWYKPFNINPEGFTSYNARLIESNFIQIGTQVTADETTGRLSAKYYARLTGSGDSGPLSRLLDTNVPVTGGWQHIQLSYSRDEQLALFYINGRLAAKIEGEELPIPGAMPESGDNVIIGRDTDRHYYAEGYIDELRFSHLFEDILYQEGNLYYTERTPVSFTYTDEPDPALTVDTISGLAIQNIHYTLDRKDGSLRIITLPPDQTPSQHLLPVASLKPGVYLLIARMQINGHRFIKTYTFVKNNRPAFTVEEHTPLIISGVNSSLYFKLGFDGDYLTKNSMDVYAGVALQVRGMTRNAQGVQTPFSRTQYLVQDFYSHEPRNRRWLWNDEAHINQENTWKDLTVDLDTIDLGFADITAVNNPDWEIRSFYCREKFNPALHRFDLLKPDSGDKKIGQILNASFTAEIIEKSYSDLKLVYLNEDNTNDGIYQYKLHITIGSGSGSSDLLNQLGISCYVVPKTAAGSDYTKVFDAKGRTEFDIYYDDLLPQDQYGIYKAAVSLKYQGQSYDTKILELNWKPTKDVVTVNTKKRLELNEFSLLSMDKKNNLAKFFAAYSHNGLEEPIQYTLKIYSGDTLFSEKSDQLSYLKQYAVIDNISIPPGKIQAVLALTSGDDLSAGSVLTVVNSTQAPELVMTNRVESKYIAYNNVLFSWLGYLNGEYLPEIKYQYRYDNYDWSDADQRWKKLELFNLAEGWHYFAVRAVYNDVESNTESYTFFVDVNKPLIDGSKISIIKKYDSAGILYAIDLKGISAAVTDPSLNYVSVNGRPVTVAEDGSFYLSELLLAIDGINEFTLTATDRVGNLTDYRIEVNNPVTELMFPKADGRIFYAPVTLAGKLNKDITVPAVIYVKDPLTAETTGADYSAWKKAKINEDRTFFADDVFVNPGTETREAQSPVEIVTVLNNDKVFTRTLDLKANTVLMPIELTLSTHAAEGEGKETVVRIDCKAKVDNISSWSVDYTGDGIYDEEDRVDNPKFGLNHAWMHSYSSIGLVKPRVRIVTRDGKYFSVADELIIHEKYTSANYSISTIANPVSFAVVPYPKDLSSRIFVLAGRAGNYRIEIHEIGKNYEFIQSGSVKSISLAGYAVVNPVKLSALDAEHLYLAFNRDGMGHIYTFKANEYYNYDLVKETVLNFEIKDMDADSSSLTCSLLNDQYAAVIPLTDLLPDNDAVCYPEYDRTYLENVSSQLSISKNNNEIYAADLLHQKVIRFSENLKAVDYIGAYGSGEKEFYQPSQIKAVDKRILVYDASRRDIQVFNRQFTPITTIAYNPVWQEENYLESGFLDNILDIEVISRETNGLIYYYGLLLSGSKEKMALVKLPQWEQLRAKIRGNQLVFIKDKELYLAKPTGSDLTKVISTDSIPGIEGTVDYPALSPDGRMIIFTSRSVLYNGAASTGDPTDDRYYNNLYLVNADGTGLTRIPLGGINQYEIERPEFSSNGDQIIFSARPLTALGLQDGYWQIYIYNMKTGGIRKLFSAEENARLPYFSPDDRYVVFTTDKYRDEEIVIVSVQDTATRIMVTANNVRDSYPVWSRVYPGEIGNSSLNIESKIAFVSEREHRWGVYYSYIKHSPISEKNISVVKKDGSYVDSDPDSAAVKVTEKGDYPCFTGSGEAVVYEYFDADLQSLRNYNFLADPPNQITTVALPYGAKRPAGMKNTISDFKAASYEGNKIKLNWRSYVDGAIEYKIQVKVKNSGTYEPADVKYVLTEDTALLEGFKMGGEYLVMVSIIENNDEVAASQWRTVEIPELSAILLKDKIISDPDNPYLVHLEAWYPAGEDLVWNYTWLIGNEAVFTSSSPKYDYEFATSGRKTVRVKVEDTADKTKSIISEPVSIDVSTDIVPDIKYWLTDTGTSRYIELDARSSQGSNIDYALTRWTVSGPGTDLVIQKTGSNVMVSLDSFPNKIYVDLVLKRKQIYVNQIAEELIEKQLMIDPGISEVKPVITYTIDNNHKQLYHFSGNHSLGNIDWSRAVWNIYRDGTRIYGENSVSTMAYEFTETAGASIYSVALTVPRRSDQKTETATMVVSVAEAPIEPVITTEILEYKEGGITVGAKVLLSCSGSKGSNIDFTSAKWELALTESMNNVDKPTQIGPTAVYNIRTSSVMLLDVVLTLCRHNGTDLKTVTKTIRVAPGEISKDEIFIDPLIRESATGRVVTLNASRSTGLNIAWERTKWLVSYLDHTETLTGPQIQLEIPASAELRSIVYSCEFYKVDASRPFIIKHDSVMLDAYRLNPVIDCNDIPGEDNTVFELSVRNTSGVNIDWERTTWHIYDGHEQVVVKYGASITHAFALKNQAYGYPVVAEMFIKGSTLPFVKYTSVNVEADELVPVIHWEAYNQGEDDHVYTFSAAGSSGRNITWSECKWTFGDSSESQYGSTVVHKYAIDDKTRSYKVSLTLKRKSANGLEETKTTYQTVTIGADQIKPVIKARIDGMGYLILSSENSEGRGLMLDRSLWVFEGKGDNENTSINQKVGTTQSAGISTGNSTTSNTSFSSTQANTTMLSSTFSSISFGGINTTTSTNGNVNITSYAGFKDITDSFSSSNIHTGAVCRKYVPLYNSTFGVWDSTSKTTLTVTLFIYRVGADGEVTGRSITRSIDLTELKKSGEKRYQ